MPAGPPHTGARGSVAAAAAGAKRSAADPREQALLAAQRLAGGGLDAHLRQLARGGQAAEIDDLVVPRAPAQLLGVRARGSLHEHLERAPHEALGALARTALHDLHQALHALDLERMRYALVHARRLRAPARGEDEREGSVVADLLDDLQRLAEVILALAGKADDDVGRQRRVRDVLADQRHAVQIPLAVIRAPHRLEDARAARLQRQVDVLAYARQLGVRADHVLAHVLGMGARIADALDP